MVDLPLWKIWRSVGSFIPNIWKNKIFPNHQPDNQLCHNIWQTDGDEIVCLLKLPPCRLLVLAMESAGGSSHSSPGIRRMSLSTSGNDPSAVWSLCWTISATGNKTLQRDFLWPGLLNKTYELFLGTSSIYIYICIKDRFGVATCFWINQVYECEVDIYSISTPILSSSHDSPMKTKSKHHFCSVTTSDQKNSRGRTPPVKSVTSLVFFFLWLCPGFYGYTWGWLTNL